MAALFPAVHLAHQFVFARGHFAPELFQKFGSEDRGLLLEQWAVLQRLTVAIESYVEARVREQLGTKR